MENIVKLRGTHISIVSNRDARFIARVWKEFQKAMGTKLKISTIFHPQIDVQSERTIQIQEDLPRSCVLD